MVYYLSYRNNLIYADVVELVDTLALGASASGREGSSPFIRTKIVFQVKYGALAHLVERFYGIEEVSSSNLLCSTKLILNKNNVRLCVIFLNIYHRFVCNTTRPYTKFGYEAFFCDKGYSS